MCFIGLMHYYIAHNHQQSRSQSPNVRRLAFPKCHQILPRPTLPIPYSLGQSSRASSIGSEAQGKGDSPPGQAKSQHQLQQEQIHITNEQSSDRKRKGRAEEQQDVDVLEQPRQRKQRLAYAAYLDPRTGLHRTLIPQCTAPRAA